MPPSKKASGAGVSAGMPHSKEPHIKWFVAMTTYIGYAGECRSLFAGP